MTAPLTVVVAGATGLVGEAVTEALEASGLPVARLHPLAGERSLGETVRFGGRSQPVARLEGFDFAGCQLAFFCTPADVSANEVPRALAQGCSVIDMSAAFRGRAEVPLVVAAVNAAALRAAAAPTLVATPGAAATALATALAPLHAIAGLTHVDAALYLSAAGAGRAAVQGLAQESIDALSGRGGGAARARRAPVAFTCSGQIGALQDGGYTALELGIAQELRRVLDAPTLAVSVTAARVPVFHGDAAAVHVRTHRPLKVSEARRLLETAPGVTLLKADGPRESAKRDTVYVARIRDDLAPERGLNLWTAGDGAIGSAVNSVRIADALVRQPI